MPAIKINTASMNHDAGAGQEPRLFLNSYGPLVVSPAGRAAAKAKKLPPFIDGSIRREPDLQHRYPGISCLCRAGKFAPRLKRGDIVCYLTQKRKYQESQGPERRLTAVLQVLEVFSSHQEAASWYRSHGLALPSNCMIRGNKARPLRESHGLHRDNPCFGGRLWKRWDDRYRDRVRRFSTFALCKRLFRDLSWNAPVVQDADLRAVFGTLPGTQNPGAWPMAKLRPLQKRLGIRVLV